LDEATVVGQLSGSLDKQHRLVRNQSSWLMAVGGQRLSRYRFRHILFQRYLYHNLDEAERVYLHQAVSQVLEQLYEGQLEEVAVELARHFQMAGLVAEAVDYLHQAGDRAVRLSAYQEAIAHYSRALELLESLPGPARYAHQELNLQLALGRAQIAVKGSAAPEVEHAFSRARELGQQLEDTPLLMIALGGLLTYYIVRGYHPQAYELAEQCLQLAQELEDPPLIIGAHLGLGQTSLFRGRLAQAQTQFEQAFALYNPGQSADLVSHSGNEVDPGVFAQRQLAWVKWLQGYPEQALVLVRQALALAQKIEHPFSIVGALAISSSVHRYRREKRSAKAWAEKTIALSSDHGFVLWRLIGMIYRGWALAEQGQEEEGIEQIRQGLDAYSAAGARTGRTNFLSLLAGVHLRLGQVSEGLAILEQSLNAVEQTGERYSEAELYRLKGELLRIGDAGVAEVERQFFKAINTARQQCAMSWELRAVVSLCRLWQAQGKKEEARQMLADIYGWFTEGFDTIDLIEAKVLLKELS
jgi:predicted ATPase